MKTITITFNGDFWSVYYEDKVADKLYFEEMIGLIAALTINVGDTKTPCLHWLKPVNNESL